MFSDYCLFLVASGDSRSASSFPVGSAQLVPSEPAVLAAASEAPVQAADLQSVSMEETVVARLQAQPVQQVERLATAAL